MNWSQILLRHGNLEWIFEQWLDLEEIISVDPMEELVSVLLIRLELRLSSACEDARKASWERAQSAVSLVYTLSLDFSGSRTVRNQCSLSC